MIGFEITAVGEFCFRGGAAIDEVVISRSKRRIGFDGEEGNKEEAEGNVGEEMT